MAVLSHLKSVLIVEDDFLIAAHLEDLLRIFGCGSTDAVGTCAGALELVAASAYDLATVDIKLQDGDCHELVEALHRSGIPFIYVTGCDRSMPVPREAPWVFKPVPDDELISAVLEVAPKSATARGAAPGS